MEETNVVETVVKEVELGAENVPVEQISETVKDIVPVVEEPSVAVIDAPEHNENRMKTIEDTLIVAGYTAGTILVWETGRWVARKVKKSKIAKKVGKMFGKLKSAFSDEDEPEVSEKNDGLQGNGNTEPKPENADQNSNASENDPQK